MKLVTETSSRTHFLGHYRILPPAAVRKAWKKDYLSMQESMIYEESPSFGQLIAKLATLSQRINVPYY